MDIHISGLKAAMKKLEELGGPALVNRVVEGAGRAALKPIVAEVRAKVPVDEGAARKSIGIKKAKRAPHRTVVLSVGARRGFAWKDAKGKRHDPFFYLIPLEYGHQLVAQGTGVRVGYIAPVGMLRSAYQRGRVRIVEDFKTEFFARVEKALA